MGRFYAAGSSPPVHRRRFYAGTVLHWPFLRQPVLRRIQIKITITISEILLFKHIHTVIENKIENLFKIKRINRKNKIIASFDNCVLGHVNNLEVPCFHNLRQFFEYVHQRHGIFSASSVVNVRR